MKADNRGYKQIFKATSLFGGLQLVNVIISIVKSKFVAVFLGPTGMGIVGLLTNTIGLISSITNFGLGTSSVRSISSANGLGDIDKVARVSGTLKMLVWITGILGSLVLVFTANWLSELTFGNREFSSSFYWLSITMLLNQLSSGNTALLQGMQRIKLLAKSSLLASISGLVITVPIYFYFGISGIVPVFIANSILTFIISFFLSKQIKLKKINISIATIADEGRSMLSLGFLIGLTGIMDYITVYATLAYLRGNGDIQTVGLYTAGFAIVNGYMGMVFSAMLTDYYPRLASISSDNFKAKIMVNQQAEIAVLILSPIVIFVITTISVLIPILFSEEFMLIEKMLYWAMMGVLFKALNWALGIIVLAKGDSKKYTIIYVIAIGLTLTTNLVGFSLFGLEGLGLAYLTYNLLMTIIGYFVAHLYYSFSLGLGLMKIFIVQFVLCLITFILAYMCGHDLSRYIFSTIIFVLSAIYSLKELDNRIDLKSIFTNLYRKIK